MTPKPPPTDPLLTARDLAEWLGYSVDTIYRYVRMEGLPVRRMAGARVRFVRSDVQSWLDSRRVVASAPVPDPVTVAPQAPRGRGRPKAADDGGGGWAERLKAAGKGS